MIKAIIFDAGGVYFQGSFIDFVNRSYKILGIENRDFIDKKLIFNPDYNRGEITAEECFRNYFGVPISEKQMEKILDFWTTTWKLNDEMVNLVRRLKENYKLAILSNSDLINSEKYTERGWYSPFDVLVLSHEEGILKPERKIYEIVLEKLGMSPEECVFIDDQKEALLPAKEMGMKTILYESIEQLERELDDLGVKFN